MTAKQTAVEWLIEELIESQYFPYGTPIILIQQAKEMEKQQIVEAVDCCFASLKLSDDKNMFIAMTAEQYYNETFKNTNK